MNLFINACVRSNSRTEELASELLSKIPGEVTEVKLKDISFPAFLKQFFECIIVTGITFAYTPEGYPRGLCKAKQLYYITTAGGNYVPESGSGSGNGSW